MAQANQGRFSRQEVARRKQQSAPFTLAAEGLLGGFRKIGLFIVAKCEKIDAAGLPISGEIAQAEHPGTVSVAFSGENCFRRPSNGLGAVRNNANNFRVFVKNFG
jgi:hypothetical protein